MVCTAKWKTDCFDVFFFVLYCASLCFICFILLHCVLHCVSLAWFKSSTTGKTHLFSCSTDHDVVSQAEEYRYLSITVYTSNTLPPLSVLLQVSHPLSTAYKPIERASTTAIAVAPRGGFATFSNAVPTSRR